MRKRIDSEELRRIIEYDPETGILRDKGVRTRGVKGRALGNHDKDGYLLLKVYQVTYKAHRLAWLYVHGEWPKNEIDHINGVKDDNRIANLRDVSQSFNQHNILEAMKNSKSGVRGVRRLSSGSWEANIRHQGKRVRLGTFGSINEAGKAYQQARLRLHAGFIKR